MSSDKLGTRGRILQSAYGLFYREGFSRVSVDDIAARAKLTKRTVYYHFKSKDDIVAAALEDLHRHLMPQFKKWIGPEANTPGAVIEGLFAELRRWADGKKWLGSGFSRIAAELADMPGHPARHAASSHKASVEEWLAGEFSRTGCKAPHELARQVMILIEGSIGLALIHGDNTYIKSAGIAASNLLSDG